MREKRQFDRLGWRMGRAVRASADPEGTYLEYEPRLVAEAAEHNALFEQAGLKDCAR